MPTRKRGRITASPRSIASDDTVGVVMAANNAARMQSVKFKRWSHPGAVKPPLALRVASCSRKLVRRSPHHKPTVRPPRARRHCAPRKWGAVTVGSRMTFRADDGILMALAPGGGGCIPIRGEPKCFVNVVVISSDVIDGGGSASFWCAAPGDARTAKRAVSNRSSARLASRI
jgi:hypothetical protein